MILKTTDFTSSSIQGKDTKNLEIHIKSKASINLKAIFDEY